MLRTDAEVEILKATRQWETEDDRRCGGSGGAGTLDGATPFRDSHESLSLGEGRSSLGEESEVQYLADDILSEWI